MCGQHSAVLYICLPWLLSKYRVYNINIITRINSPPLPTPIQKTALFCTFSLFNFSSVFQGVSWPHLPLCVDARGDTFNVAVSSIVGRGRPDISIASRYSAGLWVCVFIGSSERPMEFARPDAKITAALNDARNGHRSFVLRGISGE